MAVLWDASNLIGGNLGHPFCQIYQPSGAISTTCLDPAFARSNTLDGNSQNFLRKFVIFFVTLSCFYKAIIHRK